MNTDNSTQDLPATTRPKVSLLIKGDVYSEKGITVCPPGGFAHCPESDLDKHYDTSEATVIWGDLNIDFLLSPHHLVVATGPVDTKK